MTCNHCGAEVESGLLLCRLCQRKAETILEYLPVYFRNLARWRPVKTAESRPVPGSRVLYQGETRRPDATGDRISDALDDAGKQLVIWAHLLVDARPFLARLLDRLTTARTEERIDDAQMVAWLCAGFARHLPAVATLDWCGEFVRTLDHHERRLRGLTETAVPGWYAGACRRCGSATYVVPGLTWVTCNGQLYVGDDSEGAPVYHHCGVTTYARDHLEVVLDEARDWVAPPMRIAEAVVALVDTEQSVPRLHKRISKWGEERKVKAVRDGERVTVTQPPRLQAHRRRDADGDEVGPKRYRLGDVLDLLRAQGQTRLALPRKGEAS